MKVQLVSRGAKHKPIPKNRRERWDIRFARFKVHVFPRASKSSQLCGDTTWSWGALAALEEWSLQEEYVQQYREIRDGRAEE